MKTILPIAFTLVSCVAHPTPPQDVPPPDDWQQRAASVVALPDAHEVERPLLAAAAAAAPPPAPVTWPATTLDLRSAAWQATSGPAWHNAVTRPPAPPSPPREVTPSSLYGIVDLSGGRAPFAEALIRRVADSMRTLGAYRYVPHASVCATTATIPTLVPGSNEPVIGEEITITCAVPAAWFPLIMVEIAKPAVDRDADLSIFGMSGCRLALDLEKIIFFAPQPTGLVTRDAAGRVTVRWTPEPSFVGYTVTWQALMLVPRSVAASERLLSGGLQVNVGAR